MSQEILLLFRVFCWWVIDADRWWWFPFLRSKKHIVLIKNMFRLKWVSCSKWNPSQPPFVKGRRTASPFLNGDLSASGGLRGIFRNGILRIVIIDWIFCLSFTKESSLTRIIRNVSLKSEFKSCLQDILGGKTWKSISITARCETMSPMPPVWRMNWRRHLMSRQIWSPEKAGSLMSL